MTPFGVLVVRKHPMNDAYRRMDFASQSGANGYQSLDPNRLPPPGSSPTSDEFPSEFWIEVTEDLDVDQQTNVIDDTESEDDQNQGGDEPGGENAQAAHRPRVDLDA